MIPNVINQIGKYINMYQSNVLFSPECFAFNLKPLKYHCINNIIDSERAVRVCEDEEEEMKITLSLCEMKNMFLIFSYPEYWCVSQRPEISFIFLQTLLYTYITLTL